MRDYLFRGKTLDGRWHFGDGIYYGPRGVLITSETETVMVDGKTVGVAIKKQDINGKEIYTGDIVAVLNDPDGYYQVEYSKMDAKYVLVSDDIEEDFGSYNNSDLEVIDNIHDNLELPKEDTL